MPFQTQAANLTTPVWLRVQLGECRGTRSCRYHRVPQTLKYVGKPDANELLVVHQENCQFASEGSNLNVRLSYAFRRRLRQRQVDGGRGSTPWRAVEVQHASRLRCKTMHHR